MASSPLAASFAQPATTQARVVNPTWTPKVCKIMAQMAVFRGLGLLFAYFGGLGKP